MARPGPGRGNGTEGTGTVPSASPSASAVVAPRQRAGGGVAGGTAEALEEPEPEKGADASVPGPRLGTGRSAPRQQVEERRPARASRGEPSGRGGQEAPSLGDAGLTLEELAQASGLTGEEARDLESYGLLAGRSLGGVTYYDEDALEVARLAARFAEHGVEARHLRLHLLAAQREAGFIEQIVMPYIKQRNPASRQLAQETVSELARRGQELRSVLLHRSLRELLGG